MSEIKRIDIAEFRAEGYMQEINRRLLHPLGLALEVTSVDAEGWTENTWRVQDAARRMLSNPEPDPAVFAMACDTVIRVLNALYPPGSQHLSGCWDYRGDAEGIYYEGFDLEEKAQNVDRLLSERAPARQAALGYVIQPVGRSEDAASDSEAAA
jgi:hypothetical protein